MAVENTKLKIWVGRILSGLAVLFLSFDGVTKFFMDKLPPEALEAGAALQWPIEKMPLVGTILLTCLLLYVIPRTAVLGAILLTGYLGGAIASHVRVSSPLFTHTLLPIYLAIFIWLGLYLRDSRVKTLISK
ncbi:DoxX family protein [Bdellovibrio reynosensis]|uniref:DoxX family protein n=1 Tax=Bdellovibrio reynosensis TaxID=2835041 RepID=A0ABY4C6K5_9BACT|nr:DoxX family protein [Bdellovibrio reynosensis]UOF00607.1 DoxX family protein [Bdellovibrio reynosensis]